MQENKRIRSVSEVELRMGATRGVGGTRYVSDFRRKIKLKRRNMGVCSSRNVAYREGWRKGSESDRHSGDSGPRFGMDPVNPTTSCRVYAVASRKYQNDALK
jgi:hypothetical protein